MGVGTRVAALGLGVALALAGCGGGSSNLSRSDLVAKINKICAAGNAKQKQIKAPADFNTNPVAAAAALDKLLAIVKPEIAQIKGLKPESSVKPDFTTYTAALDHMYALVSGADQKAHAKDASGLQDIATAAQFKTATLDPAGKKLGLGPACQQ